MVLAALELYGEHINKINWLTYPVLAICLIAEVLAILRTSLRYSHQSTSRAHSFQTRMYLSSQQNLEHNAIPSKSQLFNSPTASSTLRAILFVLGQRIHLLSERSCLSLPQFCRQHLGPPAVLLRPAAAQGMFEPRARVMDVASYRISTQEMCFLIYHISLTCVYHPGSTSRNQIWFH